MAEPTLRLDLRAVLPIVALATVVLIIIFVQLCGSEDVEPRAQGNGAPILTATPFTPGPSPTPGPTATPDPSGPARDLTRRVDLATIEAALAEYRQENGGYPNTNGNIQTLCAFVEVDEGCALREVLDPVPGDPLGNPSGNGYWYASDGQSYIVYAQRESEQTAECPDHPVHLGAFASLLCVQGP